MHTRARRLSYSDRQPLGYLSICPNQFEDFSNSLYQMISSVYDVHLLHSNPSCLHITTPEIWLTMIMVLTSHNTAAAEKPQCIKSSMTDHIQENAIEELHHRANDTHPLPMVNHKRTLNSLNCASANDGFGKTSIGTHIVETISRSKVLQLAGRET